MANDEQIDFSGIATDANKSKIDFSGIATDADDSVVSGLEVLDIERDERARQERIDKEIRKLSALSSNLERFDDKDTFGEGADDFLLLMDMGRNNGLSDKRKKFEATYPSGSLDTFDFEGETVMVARKNPSEPFRVVSRVGESLGAVVSEPVAGAVAGSFFGPVGTAVGAMAGSLTKEGVESARGFGELDLEGSGSRAVTEGVIAGGLDAATRGLGKLAGLGRTKLEAESVLLATKAAAEEGLEPLAKGQVSQFPLVRDVFQQTGGTSGITRDKVVRQQRSLRDVVSGQITDDAFVGTTEAQISHIISARAKEIDSLLSPTALRRDIPIDEAGAAIQKAITGWKSASKEWVGRKYDRAFATAKTDDVAFDLAEAQVVANDVRLGVVGRGVEGDDVALAATPSGELKDVVDTLLKLDPSVSTIEKGARTITAFEQLKTLRTRLFDLKESTDGGIRRESSRLWKVLTDAIDSPKGGNNTFKRQWRAASKTNAFRESQLEKSFVALALKTDTPEAIANRYLSPGNTSALRTIKQLVPKKDWDTYRGFFVNTVTQNPKQGAALLERFSLTDPKGLRLLLRREEEVALKRFLRGKEQLLESTLVKSVARDRTNAERAIFLAQSGTGKELADAVKLSGGLDSPMATSMRQGVYKNLLDKSSKRTDLGVEVADPNVLLSEIKKLKSGGRLDGLFRPQDWIRIENWERYSAIVGQQAIDVGGSMQAGAVRAGIRQPSGFGKAISILLGNTVTASILARPASYSILRVAGSKINTAKLSQLVVAGNAVKRQLERGTSLNQENKQ